jgi:hypothetical protein
MRKVSKNLIGAYNKGSKAKEEGKKLSDCPYKDKRKDDGRLTWSRAFKKAWEDGYNGLPI